MSNTITSGLKNMNIQNQQNAKDANQALDENKRKIEEMLRNGKPILQPLKMEKEIIKIKPETNTNIELISHSTPIEIIPPEVIIHDIDINQTYEVILHVRNLTNHGRRIRCFQPKTSYFRCDYDIQGALSAGLAMKLLLSFETNLPGDYHDELEILSEDFRAKVLLHAYMPQANIIFDPFINLGFCQVNKEKVAIINFKNDGKKEGKISLKFERANTGIKADPSEFKIKAQEKKQIKLIYQPQDAGILRTMIEVIQQGQPTKNIDISATSVDYFIFIIDENGNQTTEFNFNNMYFGQAKEIEGYLVNNSPKRFNFKTKFSLRGQTTLDEMINLQTPNQMGYEQTQRVMYCTPEIGTIDSYSQIPIKFTCKSRVTENMVFWTRYYAMSKGKEPDDDHPMIINEYAYMCMIEFEGTSDSATIMHLEARGICPTVKISSHMINFGDCDVHDRKDYLMILENLNEEIPIDFTFSKIAQFNVTPKQGKLNPLQSLNVIVSFEPKNLGKFNGVINLDLLNNYKIPIDVIGTSSNIQEKPIKKRGIESMPTDYEVNHQFVSDDKILLTTKKTKKKNDNIIFTSVNLAKSNSALMNSSIMEASNLTEKLEEQMAMKTNKEKYNEYLNMQRQKRYKLEKDRKLKEKFDIQQEKPEEKIPIPAHFATHDYDPEEKKLIHPYDAEFWFGTNTQVLESTVPKLSEAKDPLYVTKQLGKYEPTYIEIMENFKPDPNKQARKPFASKPSSLAESRYCTMELHPEFLQKIFAGPTVIDFGLIYIKSRISKYLSVKNELKHCIMVQLDIEDHEELRSSYLEPQIIPSMQTASFEIVFCSKILQTFKGTITYSINGKHNFKCLLTCQVDPVKLELSKTTLRLSFPETNMDMETSEIIKVHNKGNAQGKFQWIIPSSIQNIISIKPDKGEVPAHGYVDLVVTYRPSGNYFRGEGDKLIMKVEDGEDQALICTGHVNEAKCILKVPSIELGDVPVGNPVTKYFSIKNTIKNVAVFNINPILPPYVTISPMKGKILADQSQDISVTFSSPEEIPVNQDIIINIRGSKELRLGFTANPLLPRVVIKEDEFDFGEIIYGNSSTLSLTIVNEGTIAANLEVDLEEKEGFKEYDGVECLDLVLADGYADDESVMFSINKSMDLDKSNEDKDLTSVEEEEEEDSEEEAKEKEVKKQFQVLVKPKSTLKFTLKFTPKDVRNYLLELPITLKGYRKIDGLRKNISCKAMRPRFLIEPQVIDFKKKIINSYEIRSGSNGIDIEISNPDSKLITWKIDLKPYDENQPFTIKPSQGKLESGQKSQITVNFQPVKQDDYQETVYFYLDSDTKPYIEVTLKGTGAFPKLNFDRREVILPIVPLDIEAKCTFKILNDGFENLTLKHKLPPEVSTIPLQLNFPDGLNLGITNNKIKVEVLFKSKKPLSFTTDIQFIDDENHLYIIKVSGTADNCLLTTFPYILRTFGDHNVIIEEGKPVRLNENQDSDSESSHKGTSVEFSKAGSTISKLSRNILGYKPIPIASLEKTCEFIVRWLKDTSSMQLIQKFPADVIENNGSQIFELITFLCGKNLSFKAKFENITKKEEKIKILYKQYDDLIRYLKENGALLNTIRPEYLLKLHDYNMYIKSNPNAFVNPNLPKITEKNFYYISMDSWTTLFFQILKIFYLSRVNYKLFKTLPGMPNDKLNIPDYYLEGSNLYNTSEGILLRWFEIHYEIIKGGNITKRLTNFDTQLRDGQFFATVIQSYVGSSYVRTVSQLKQICNNEDDYKYNAEKIIKGLEEIGLHSNFTAKDIYAPSQRENILFALFLYNNLPHYIPKSTIEFSCTLGDTLIKNIELKNTTNKAVCYWIRLESHPDFTIENDRVRLEGDKSALYPITYNSRISVPVGGRIFFTNSTDGVQRAAALVFDLKSNITARRSRAEIKIDGKLYELKIKEIVIENPFNSDAEYQITLNHEKIEFPEEVKPKKKGKKEKDKETIKSEEEYIIPAFFIKREKILVRKNTTATLQVQFLPFIMETQKCNIILCDEKVGEIQYTLIGEVSLPNIIDPIFTPPSFYLENDMNYSVSIQPKNPLLEKAKNVHYDRLTLMAKTKEKENAKNKESDTINFEIESLTQYITLPSQITIVDMNKKLSRTQGPLNPDNKDKKKKNQNDVNTVNEPMGQTGTLLTQNTGMASTENRLTMSLNFKTPIKDQEFKFMLRNKSKTDIRIFVVKLTILPKPVKAIIEMIVPARRSITQEIPIINNSDKDWQFKVTLTNSDSSKPWFSGPNNFMAKKKVKNVYPLTFKPAWCLPVTGRLQLLNLSTTEQFDYELKGTGEEPLAEDQIVLYCKARSETTYEIPITNPTENNIQYAVETDLPNPKGDTQFIIPPRKTKNYKLSVTPMLGGTFSGSITFYDSDRRYIWYIVELKTENSKSEKPPVDLLTLVRKAVVYEINISNPLKEVADFDVNVIGEGLVGDNTLKVLPGQSATYELIYSPLKPMKSTGSALFVNEKIGEILYEFRLIAEEQPSVRLPILKCELGKSQSHEINLENPSNKLVKIRYRISNPNNFSVSPEEIIIRPFDSKTVLISYMPSDLDVIESGEVIFDSDEIDKWVYLVFGSGIPPTKFDEKIISGALNKDSSGTINFRNPFREPIMVNISLENIDKKYEAFNLLLKKSKIQIGPLNVFQIPFSFLPKSISEYFAEIVVAMNEKISWKYPLKGITESNFNLLDFNLKTKCRIKHEQELKFSLPGIPEIDPKDTYTLQIVNIPKDFQNILSRWLSITPLKSTLDHIDDYLLYNVKFIPMKPIKAVLDIAVIKSSGGRWKFKLILEASDPDPDDIIFITSSINKTSSVSFKLTNAYKQSAEFLAGFSPDSDPEFTVMPKTGYLDAYGKEGTTFVISFIPIEYGKLRVGKLIIQTDEMYWSYQVKGDLPKYVAPQAKVGKVETRLQPELETKLSHKREPKKNYLAENIRNSKVFSPRERGRHSRSKSRSLSPTARDNTSIILQKKRL